MSLYALCLYRGEKKHIKKSLEATKKIADKVFIFSHPDHVNDLFDESVSESIVVTSLEWNSSFSDLRNRALDVIFKETNPTDWIISIDADEYLDPESSWKITSHIDMFGGSHSIDGIEVEIVNNSTLWPTSYEGSIPQTIRKLKTKDVRIFRAVPAFRFVGRINESLDINPSLISQIDIKIFHHAHRYTDTENEFLCQRQDVMNEWAFKSQNEKDSYTKEEFLFYSKVDSTLAPLKQKNKKTTIGFFCLHYDPPIGGAERSMHSYFKALSEDYDIEVFCFLDENGMRHKEYEKIEIDGVTIHKTSKEMGDVTNEFCKKRTPDVIMTQLLGSEIVIKVASLNGIPCIYFVHGLFEDICRHYLMKTCQYSCLETCGFSETCPNGEAHKVLKTKYEQCHSIICNSYYTKSIFRRFFPETSSKIKIVFPNFDYDLFQPRGPMEKTNTFLAVNTSPPKGRNVIINIAGSNPDIKFIYVDSRDRDKIYNNVKNIEFRGRLSREEMAKIYHEIDAVVCPTLMDETFGGVVSEAVLSGVPVVCSNKGNLPNLVMNGKNGIILQDFSTESWSTACRQAQDMEVDLSVREQLLSDIDQDCNLSIIRKEIDDASRSNIANHVYIAKHLMSKQKVTLQNNNYIGGIERYDFTC